MRRANRALLLTILATLCIPAQGWTRTFVNPWTGVIFGNDQAASGFRSFGVAFGEAPTRYFGTETSVGFTTNFFGSSVPNYVLDLSAGVLVGPNIGTSRNVTPYLAAGVSSLRASINGVGTLPKATRNSFALNVGAGVLIDFASSLGLRGEVRYYRAFGDDGTANSLNADLSHFQFWRASIGLMIW